MVVNKTRTRTVVPAKKIKSSPLLLEVFLIKSIKKLLLYFSGFVTKSKKGNIEATPLTSKIDVITDKIRIIKKYNFCFLVNKLYSLLIDSNYAYVPLININKLRKLIV